MEKIKRYSLIEVVLLAIFVMGLLIAGLIVKGRSKILLSEPLTLFGSGVSVSMPANPGWEQTPGWQYEESVSSMTLVGQFGSPGRGRIEVRWRYLLSTPAGSAQELLTRQGQEKGAMIQDIQTIGQDLPMTYAKMYSAGEEIDEFYLGVVRLEYNRSLELVVKSSRSNGYYEERIFESLAGSIQYHTPEKLAAGHALMDAFLLARSTSLSEQPTPNEAFVIKETGAAGNTGYYTAAYTAHADPNQTLSQLHIRQFEDRRLNLESWLWLDLGNRQYRWKTALRFPGTREAQTYEIQTDADGLLVVTSNVKETKTFAADQFLLPEPLLPEAARQLLLGDVNDAVIDVLAGTGQLVPVYLEKMPVDQAAAKSQKMDAVVRVTYLHTLNSYEELFFDASRTLFGKFEQQPRQRGRIWDAVSTDQLQHLFQTDFQPSAEAVAWQQ